MCWLFNATCLQNKIHPPIPSRCAEKYYLYTLANFKKRKTTLKNGSLGCYSQIKLVQIRRKSMSNKQSVQQEGWKILIPLLQTAMSEISTLKNEKDQNVSFIESFQ